MNDFSSGGATRGGDQFSLILGLIAVTIQFIRCCIEIIKSASIAVDALSSATTTTKETNAEQQQPEKKNGSGQKSSSSNDYGSMETPSQVATVEVSSPNDQSTSNNNKNKTNGTSGGDEEMQRLLSSSAGSSTTRPFVVTTLFQMVWIIFLIFFAIVGIGATISHVKNTGTIVSSSSTSTSLLSSEDDPWSNNGIKSTNDYFVVCLAVMVVGIECILFSLYYKPCLQRYGIVNYVLQVGAAILLWCAVTIPMLVRSNDESSLSLPSTSHLPLFDYVYAGVVTLYVIAALVQRRLLKDAASATKKGMTKEQEQNKIHLSTLRPLLRPYFWPDETANTAFGNRIRAVSTWVCVILSKVCNLVSPLYLGWASTALAHGQIYDCIWYSVAYSVISWFGSTLKECQSLVYLEVAQAAFVQLSETAFGHLHRLSLDWHLKKKLGEVIRSMDRGIAACDTLMKYLFLWLAPALIECVVVCGIFATYFQYLPLAVTVFYFVLLYVVWTIVLTIWRKKYRKALTKHDNEWHDLFTDSMINFETVKFFTAEQYEQERFKQAVMQYQAGTVDVQASLSFLNISQQVILKMCLAASLTLSAIAIQQRLDCCTNVGHCEVAISDCCSQRGGAGYEVCSTTGMQIGDFVAVLTYTLNLFAPLNFLGSVYNAVVMAVIDLTNMSELLAENPDVVDARDAVEVPTVPSGKNGDVVVEFDNVHFHYPTQPEARGLKGLSFQMKRGTTTAIVGPVSSKQYRHRYTCLLFIFLNLLIIRTFLLLVV
jgi:ABC-type multidrug transport system fused ATPase/permease subunit